MIKSITAHLKANQGAGQPLELAEKITYKKPTEGTQPAKYLFYVSSGGKIRTQTGYRQRFSFYIVSDTMDGLDTLGKNLENLLVGAGQQIDPKIWRVLQNSEKDFENEMLRVIDFTFYYKF